PQMRDEVVLAAQTGFLNVSAAAAGGYVRLVKGRLQGRRGAGAVPPHHELRKTYRKGMVIPASASWLFPVAPFPIVGATLAASPLARVVSAAQPAGRLGVLFVLAALLRRGPFFLPLVGVDPGAVFGGMGSSREMTVAALTEPPIAIAVLTLALTTGSTSL